MTHFPYFGHNDNFPENAKTVTFTHFVMPFIRYDFRKIQRTDLEKRSEVLILDPKIPHSPILGKTRIFLKK